MQNEGFSFFDPTNTGSYSVFSDGKVSVTGNFPKYSNTSGILITDSGVPFNSFNDYVKLDGSTPMQSSWNTGSLDMVIGNIYDSVDNTYDIGTSSAKKRKIYSHEMETAIVKTPTDVVNMGKDNTTIGLYPVSLGSLNTMVGTNYSILTGHNNSSTSANGQSIMYGFDNSDANAAGGSFIYGFNNVNGTGQRNILLGRNLTVPNATNEAFVMGFGITNSTANSFLIGGVSQANIRAGSTICDLGTTANRFKDLHLSGSLIGAVKTSAVDDIVTGPATATTNGICTYNGTTGKLIQSNTTTIAQLVPYTGATANLNMGLFTLLGKASQPAVLSKFQTTANFSIPQNTSVNSIISGTNVGSLVYAANTTGSGQVICVRIAGIFSNTSPNTQTIILKVNGGAVITYAFPTATSVNLAGILEFQITLRDTPNALTEVCHNSTGLSPIIVFGLSSWDTTISNTITITNTYSSATSYGTIFAIGITNFYQT